MEQIKCSKYITDRIPGKSFRSGNLFPFHLIDIMIKIFHTREGLILHEKLCKQYFYIIGYVRHNRGAGRWEGEGVINGSRLLTVYGNMNAYLILELIPERYLSQSHSASNSKTYLIFKIKFISTWLR